METQNVLTVFAPTMPWRLLFITRWAAFRNRNRPQFLLSKPILIPVAAALCGTVQTGHPGGGSTPAAMQEIEPQEARNQVREPAEGGTCQNLSLRFWNFRAQR
jgi:hypothetical protein